MGPLSAGSHHDPHSATSLEHLFIEEYLHEMGTSLREAHSLPHDEYHRLMCKAVTYAALRLAEVEAHKLGPHHPRVSDHFH